MWAFTHIHICIHNLYVHKIVYKNYECSENEMDLSKTSLTEIISKLKLETAVKVVLIHICIYIYKQSNIYTLLCLCVNTYLIYMITALCTRVETYQKETFELTIF